MPEIAYRSEQTDNNQFAVTRAIDTSILSGDQSVAIVVENTVPKQRILESLNAAMRAINRDFGKASDTADLPGTGTTRE